MTTTIPATDIHATVEAERQLGRRAEGFTAHYEREVNEHGVPVRRLHLVGEWEVDPSALREARDAA